MRLLLSSKFTKRIIKTGRRSRQTGWARRSSLVVLVSLLLVISLLAYNRLAIFDWWRLRNYQAPAPIAQLATQDTMTAYARKLFYINYPTIVTKTGFDRVCPNNDASESIVLGCYHGNEGGIYLLKVDDPVLSGVEQVTAAHEMLHGAYDRLSPTQRTNIDAMLMSYYLHDLHNPRIKAEITIYQKTEPHDVLNEMHSTFGTEVEVLPNALEHYYATLFTNRQHIVAYANAYQAQFTSRQMAVMQDDVKLTALNSQITQQESSLKTQEAIIQSEQQRLEQERTSNPTAYNNAVPSSDSQIDAYNVAVNQLQTSISQYDQLVAARNLIATAEDQLANEVTAEPSPISK